MPRKGGRKAPRPEKNIPTLAKEATRYASLADSLSEAIRAELPARSRLPGEHELARRFKVSRVTVRAALAVLERDGLIERKPGAGTFVAPQRAHHDLAMLETFFEQFARRGVRPKTKLLEYAYSDRINPAIMGRPEAVRLSRVWYADGAPFAVTHSYLHRDARRLSAEEAERTPGFEILRDLGHHIVRADLTVRAAKASKSAASALEIGANDPILILNRTSYSAANEPLEHTECLLRSDAVEFSLAVNGPVPLAAAFHRPGKRTHRSGTN